jgi:hypothetical protein
LPTPAARRLRGLPSSADEVELVHRLRSEFVLVVEHDLAGNPVEVAGTPVDDEPAAGGVVWPNVAPVLQIAEATDLTVEMKDPTNMPDAVLDPDAPAVTPDTVVVMRGSKSFPVNLNPCVVWWKTPFSKTLKW